MRLRNVILICSDHDRASAAGCYGHPICRTPALDRLAAQGVRFDRCFTQNPVCMPARASLLTGTNSRRNGVRGNGDGGGKGEEKLNVHEHVGAEHAFGVVRHEPHLQGARGSIELGRDLGHRRIEHLAPAGK